MERTDFGTPAYAIELTWGGKLPSMGDFVWSNPRTPLRIQLDDWLLAGVQQLRLTLGEGWRSSFDRGVMWNFIVPAGVLGSGCAAGCISPSCDQVGRRFPFTVAYGFSAHAPARYLSQAVHAIPGLLSHTGALLFNGIRRQWPRDTLGALIKETLTQWQKPLTPAKPADLSAPGSDSVILDVLMQKDSSAAASNDVPAPPGNRFSALPWGNVADRLGAGSATSFWWTNGAGGADLKAFTYGARLDGTLMTWLFGLSAA